MALCTITGLVFLPSGEPASDRVMIVSPRNMRLTPVPEGVIWPTAIEVQTGPEGSVNFVLETGVYDCRVQSGLGWVHSSIEVPEAATAIFADILDPVIPPPYNSPLRLPIGLEGQIVRYGPGGIPFAGDPPEAVGSEYDDTEVIRRIEELEAVEIPEAYDDTALSNRVLALEEAPAPEAYDDAALANRVLQLEEAPAPEIPEAYDDTALANRVLALEEAPAPTWGEVSDKPEAFPPAEHDHQIEDVEGLTAALQGKQDALTLKTVNGVVITGTGNIVTSISFPTDAQAAAFSAANPGVTVGSTQV